MTRDELKRRLNSMGIRRDAYSLDGGHPSEAYVSAFDGRRWRVYYSERGQESGSVEFATESDAYSHLLKLIEADPTTRM